MIEPNRIQETIARLTDRIAGLQRPDGSWRFCFENGTVTDAFQIALRTLEIENEPLIRMLHDRLLSVQQPEGSWKLYADEAGGNLAATAENLYALLYSGYSRENDRAVVQAKRYILAQGGLRKVGSTLTKAMLAATGQYPWPSGFPIPIEFMLLPASAPVSLFDFSSYARVHFVPILLLAHLRFAKKTALSPDLSALLTPLSSAPAEHLPERSRSFFGLMQKIEAGLKELAALPQDLRKASMKRAESFLLERIEPDGTLYSYATSTMLMMLALHAVGYGNRHPVIAHAVRGLSEMVCRTEKGVTLQNSPSAVWDTALISGALQEAGMPSASPVIRSANAYLLSMQHTRFGDWRFRNPNTPPGGWGFSESDTIHPDVDDSTAALRAIRASAATEPVYREAWNRGLNWVLSMQNGDGGWPAFEKNTDRELLTWLPLDEARSAAVDPSSADLTGRTLDFLGRYAGLGLRHPIVRRAADWLIDRQEEDGSWYGRWGVCYLYGAWAAVTGLRAVGLEPDHPALRLAGEWLLNAQNPDGGWGESCNSDLARRYVRLGVSTPSQTAWALDALIALHPAPNPTIDRGIHRLTELIREADWKSEYPTGAGLPGIYYSSYHSYRYIWPLLTFAHYRRKYTAAETGDAANV